MHSPETFKAIPAQPDGHNVGGGTSRFLSGQRDNSYLHSRWVVAPGDWQRIVDSYCQQGSYSVICLCHRLRLTLTSDTLGAAKAYFLTQH
jgi:hypothetical protein